MRIVNRNFTLFPKISDNRPSNGVHDLFKRTPVVALLSRLSTSIFKNSLVLVQQHITSTVPVSRSSQLAMIATSNVEAIIRMQGNDISTFVTEFDSLES